MVAAEGADTGCGPDREGDGVAAASVSHPYKADNTGCEVCKSKETANTPASIRNIGTFEPWKGRVVLSKSYLKRFRRQLVQLSDLFNREVMAGSAASSCRQELVCRVSGGVNKQKLSV